MFVIRPGWKWLLPTVFLLISGVAQTGIASAQPRPDTSANGDNSSASLQDMVEQQPDPYVPLGGTQTLTVGPNGNCDFSGLQAAINAAGDDDVIRIMDNNGYTGEVYDIIAKAITIRGGYDDCNLASTPSGRTVLDADGSSGGEMFDIFYTGTVSSPIRRVNLENLSITGADGFDGIGVLVEGNPGRLTVNLRNVEITGNSHTATTGDGAGLRILQRAAGIGSLPFVTVDNDSLIINNTAGGKGGGIYCESTFAANSNTILRVGTTLIANNEAMETGGGISINGCENVFIYSGGPFVLFFPAGGIISNTATGTPGVQSSSGGGLFAENGAEVLVSARSFSGFGDASEAALISGNEANNGGGIATRGSTTSVTVEDTYIIGNSTSGGSGSGGGIIVTQESSLQMRRSSDTSACLPPVAGGGVLSRPPCSVLDNNQSSGGSAIKVETGGQADISRTFIRNNSGGDVATTQNFGTTRPDAQLRLEATLITDNSGTFNVLEAVNNAHILLFHSTIANNAFTRIARASASDSRTASIALLSSIALDTDELASSTIFGTGDAFVSADCLIGDIDPAATGLTQTSNFYSQVDPQFADPDNGDYHLSNTSPAIDYCDDFNPPEFDDLDGNERNLAWTGPMPDPAPNPGIGNFDLGAYESPFVEPDADIAVSINPSSQFINVDQTSVMLSLTVSNNGPDDIADMVNVNDALPTEIISTQWSCAGNNGGVCSTANGSNSINEFVDLPVGGSVTFSVTGNLAGGLMDGMFMYSASATTDSFTNDPNSGNNTAMAVLRSGLFADGFEQ